MKHCIKCKVDLPDSYSFCKFCGGPLTVAPATQIDAGSVCPKCGAEVKSDWRFCKQCACDLQATLVAHGSRTCRGCGSQVATNLNFCLECGTPVVAQIQAATPGAGLGIDPTIEEVHAHSVSAPTDEGIPSRQPVSQRLRLGLIAAAAVVLFTTVGFTTYYFWFSNSAIERKLDGAITRGDLFKPEGASAYDYYNQLKKNQVDHSVLGRYAEKLTPKVIEQPLKVLADFAVPTNREPDLPEWQQAQKAMTWAIELNPDDTALAAKGTYIEGRIAYLNNKKDEALSLWKRATELDKNWALAANAIGVLYNERKEYQSARQFALEAIRREPAWAVPYNNVGTSYFLEKNDDRAESYYLQAIERAPNWPRPHVWLGDIAMRRKNYSQAASEYEAALNLAVPGTTTLDLTELKNRADAARKKAQGLNVENQAELEKAKSSWSEFVTVFRTAVKKRDRATLRGLIAVPFLTQSDGEIRSPDEVLRWLDESQFWEQLEREIGTPTGPDAIFQGNRGRPQLCTNGIFCFEYGKDNRWRLAEQGEGEV